MDYLLKDHLKLTEKQSHAASKLIDRKEKMSGEEFKTKMTDLIGEKAPEFLTMLDSKNFEDFIAPLPQDTTIGANIDEMRLLLSKLEALGITNTRFDQSLMRGFDYYTGVVFEVFDTNPENRRSLFGGGRYDELLDIFGVEPVPTVGFGMGDVTMRDVLETYGLLPKPASKTHLYIVLADKIHIDYAEELAQTLREKGVRVAVDFTGRKIGDQIKYADKNKIPFITVIGEQEVKTGTLKIKELATGKETETNEAGVQALVTPKSLSTI